MKFLLMLLAMAGVVFGEVWYVSPDGNNSNSGTDVTEPLLTINAAEDSTSGGDTVYIRAGLYREMVTVGNSGPSPETPTIFCGYPGDPAPVMQGFRLINGSPHGRRCYS